ncbi:MAG: hypothetical protein V3T83_14575 [Acidobacteriota bacterium]
MKVSFTRVMDELRQRVGSWRMGGASRSPPRFWAGSLALLIWAASSPLQAGRPLSCQPARLPIAQRLTNLQVVAISDDGRRILFSSSSNPVGLNPGQVRQIFHYDIAQNALSQVSRFSTGEEIVGPFTADAGLNRIVFASTSDLTGGNADGSSEIFWMQASSGQLTQLTDSPAAEGADGSVRPVLSGDGSRVAFISDQNLAGANQDLSPEVFLIALESGILKQLSLSLPIHLMGVPSLDREGKRVVATRNDITQPTLRARLLLFEVDSGLARSLVRASRLSDPSISQDGRLVAFLSSGDLSGGNPDRSMEVFTVTTSGEDRGEEPNLSGRIEQITHSVSTPEATVGLPVLSADGQRIFFPSRLDWTGQNPSLQNHIFLYDAVQRSLSQVTRGNQNVLTSRLPVSASGDRVAYAVITGGPSDPQSVRLPFWAACSPERQPVLIFPQIVTGGGFGSEVILTNPESSPDGGMVVFFNSDGSEMELLIDGERLSRIPFRLAPGGTLKLEPVGEGKLRAGYVAVLSEVPDSRLTGSLIYLWNGQEVSLAGSRLSKEYHVFAEQTQQTATGVALVNAGQKPLHVLLTLLDSEGEVFEEKQIQLQGREQKAEMLANLFPETLQSFKGSLHARADDHLALIGLRLRGSSLAALNSAPSAFPNSGSQILYMLDSGLDLTRMGFSQEELEGSTVQQLTGLTESPHLHLLELANIHGSQGVTLVFRYFNQGCRNVLQFLVVLNCGQSMAFDPFDFIAVETGLTTREAFFGAGPDAIPLTGSQFGTGRFVLSVTAVGHSVNADEQADILFPRELNSELVCDPQLGQVGAAPGIRNSNLRPCNARYMSFDYLIGRQIFSAFSNCQGPLGVADEQLLASTRQARQLVEETDQGRQCLAPPTLSSCPMVEALRQLGAADCQGRPVGPTAIVKIPQPTFTLLR